jgi:heparan-sulfate lyase
MGMVHNKAIFEQRGVLNVCQTFPEFKQTQEWARLALQRNSENLLAQTTTDGVQREWCLSYHNAVLRDAIDVILKAEDLGLKIPADYRERVRRMYDYVFAVTTPDLADPMFGDTARPRVESDDRRTWPRFNVLVEGSTIFDDPKYAARAKLQGDRLPKQVSYAFKEAGSYVMRSDWGPDAIYFALHCAPPPLSGHDQKDNATFELYAYGRWLITDTGYYTYGGDKEARNWHRQTQVHQTLTVDRKDIRTDGKLLLWQSKPHHDVLVVENPSYDSLMHRRSVWFVDREFFVILDEAIGQRAGTVRLHFQPATGPGKLDAETRSFATRFSDTNVLIKAAYPENIEIIQEDGWHAWNYGKREPRKTLTLVHPDAAPAAFVTVIVPYRGQQAPDVTTVLDPPFETGGDEVRLRVEMDGKSWQLSRNAATGSAAVSQ